MPTPELISQLIRLPYPPSMQVIHGIPGIAFFPGGRGLWKDGDTNLSGKKYMILGQDFDTYNNFLKAKAAGEEDVKKNKTWKNLLCFLDMVGITPEECFFTNVIMGARVSESNSGRSPAWDHPKFIKACQDLFIMHLNAQRPKLILVLGKEPARFLSALSDNLKIWSQDFTFKKVDEKNAWGYPNTYFNKANFSASVVLLVHPSMNNSNLRHRAYKGLKGNEAQVMMFDDLRM